MNKGFSYAHADENIPEMVKFEISIRTEEKQYSLDNHDCEKNEDKHIGRIFNKDCEKDCKQDYGIEYKKNDDYDKKKMNLSICADYYCKSEVITVKGCDDLVCFNLGENFFKQNGFILELSLKLKDVCPKRRTALAVILYELDKCEKECKRGFKTVFLPSTGKYVCSDICVDCLRFVVSESLDKNDYCNSCVPRKFVVRYIANYIDSDFSVCGCKHKA